MRYIKRYGDYITENYFTPTIDEDVKKLSNRYIGRNVTWYGDPDQMIVVNKEQIEGMWGNIYSQDKLDSLVDMIRNSEDNIEIECSYAMGSIIDIVDIIEEQESFYRGEFGTDYDGKEEPASIGDEELDTYIGNEDYFSDNYDLSENGVEFFTKHKFDIVRNNKTEQELKNILDTFKEDEDSIAFEDLIEKSNIIKEAIENEDGDINTFMVQLRDGHHRVSAAIEAGEDFVCVNLAKDDIERFKGHYTRVK